MSDAERALDDFFADDGLPVRDQAFTLSVMRRAARRRLRMELAGLAGTAGLISLMLWALAPSLAGFLALPMRLLGGGGPLVGGLVVAVTVLLVTLPRHTDALPSGA